MIKWLLVVIAVFLIFFTYIPYLSLLDPCSWRYICPDYGSQVDVISWRPNFYIPKWCGGFSLQCHDASWSFSILAMDLGLFGFVLLLINIKKLWLRLR